MFNGRGEKKKDQIRFNCILWMWCFSFFISTTFIFPFFRSVTRIRTCGNWKIASKTIYKTTYHIKNSSRVHWRRQWEVDRERDQETQKRIMRKRRELFCRSFFSFLPFFCWLHSHFFKFLFIILCLFAFVFLLSSFYFLLWCC